MFTKYKTDVEREFKSWQDLKKVLLKSLEKDYKEMHIHSRGVCSTFQYTFRLPSESIEKATYTIKKELETAVPTKKEQFRKACENFIKTHDDLSAFVLNAQGFQHLQGSDYIPFRSESDSINKKMKDHDSLVTIIDLLYPEFRIEPIKSKSFAPVR